MMRCYMQTARLSLQDKFSSSILQRGCPIALVCWLKCLTISWVPCMCAESMTQQHRLCVVCVCVSQVRGVEFVGQVLHALASRGAVISHSAAAAHRADAARAQGARACARPYLLPHGVQQQRGGHLLRPCSHQAMGNDGQLPQHQRAHVQLRGQLVPRLLLCRVWHGYVARGGRGAQCHIGELGTAVVWAQCACPA